MTELHVSITGDCSGLVAATKNAESAIDGLAGKRASVSVGLTGSSTVVSGLNSVGAARDRAGGTVTLGVDSSGISAGRDQLTGFRNDARALGRELDSSLGGSRIFNVGDGGSVRQLTGDLSGLSRGMSQFGTESGRAGGSANSFVSTMRGLNAALGENAQANSAAASAGGEAAAAMREAASGMGGLEASASSAMPQVRQAALVMAGGGSGSAIAESATAGSSAVKMLNQDLQDVGSTATQSAGQLQTAGTVMNRAGGSRGGPGGIGPGGSYRGPSWGGTPGSGPPGSGPPPPKWPNTSGGQPIMPGPNGRPMRGEQLSASPEFGGLGMPALVGAAGGALGVLAAAGAGLLSVNEAIKNTPGLARAANQAMGEFNKGVRSTAASALTEGVPALHALGEALGPLGSEVGKIGAANLGTTLGAAMPIVKDATTALQGLEPAIGPSIKALGGLADAVIQGIGAPGVGTAVKGLSESLQSAGLQSTVKDVTTGLLTAGSIASKVAVDVVNGVSSVVAAAGGPSFAGADPGQVSTDVTGGVGGFMLGKAFGGAKMGVAGGILGAAGMAAAQYEQSHGMESSVTPTIVGELAGAGIGGVIGGPVGAVAGGLVGGAVGAASQTPVGRAIGLGGQALSTFLNLPGQLTSPAGRAQIGPEFQALHDASNQFTSGQGAAPGGTPAQQLAAAQQAAPFGYNQDPKTGALTPSSGPGGGGGSYPGGPGQGGSGVPFKPPTPPPAPPPSSPAASGGFGQGAPTAASAQALQQLSAALPAANSSLSQTAPSAASAASGLSRVAPAAQQTAQGLQQVSQSASQMAAPMAAVSQHANTASAAVQQMATQAPQAVQAVQAVAPAAHAALSQAGSAIQSGGQAMGAQMPAAVATGVQASTSQACDASNAMAKNAAACAAAALGTHSPSKVFTVLGLSTGQGLAIGITNSTGEAVGAVKASMGAVVEGAKGALQTASPSKAFTAMGSQAMGNVAGGANSYAPGSNARYPQADNARKDAEQQAKDAAALNDPKAKSDAAFQARMKQLGYSPGTVAKLTADREREQAKTKADLDRKAHPERDKAHQARKDDAQRKAMEASGFKVDPNNPDSPHNQRATQLDAGRKILKANAKDLVNDGLTSKDPAAVQRRLTGLPGTAGNAQQQRSMNEQGKSIGDSLNKGMSDGIKKGAGGPEDAAGKMSSNVIHKTKKTLGIKSPSSEFHDVGDNCMRGWADGVNGGRGRLDKEWDDIDHDMRDRWDKWGKFNPFPSDPGGGGGSSGGGSSGGGGGGGAAQSVGPGSGELVTSGRAARRVLRSNRGGYGLTGVGGDPHFSKPLPYDKDPSRLISANIRLKQERAYDARVNALLKGVDTALTGGFGSGVTAASNGVLGIASNTGLLVGTQWGRSVVTGADSVLKTADFTAAAVPQIGSALAKTALGTLGMLGPAGSGASLQNAPGVTMNAGTPAAPPVIHNHIYIDGKEIQSMTNRQIDTAIGNLADSISRQRG